MQPDSTCNGLGPATAILLAMPGGTADKINTNWMLFDRFTASQPQRSVNDSQVKTSRPPGNSTGQPVKLRLSVRCDQAPRLSRFDEQVKLMMLHANKGPLQPLWCSNHTAK